MGVSHDTLLKAWVALPVVLPGVLRDPLLSARGGVARTHCHLLMHLGAWLAGCNIAYHIALCYFL